MVIITKIYKMKKLLFLLLYPFMLFSQNIESNKIDEFTGDYTVMTSPQKGKRFKFSDAISTDNNIFLFTGYTLSKKTNYEMYIINISMRIDNNMTCLSKGDKMILLLEDESKIECINFNQTDCSGTIVNGTYGTTPDANLPAIMPGNFYLLSLKKIKKIRIYTSDSYRDFEIKEEEKEWVRNHFEIIYSEVEKFKSQLKK